MPTIPCNYNRLPAQTLFLGASVASFNTNMGWGGQPSQLTVTLVEDLGCNNVVSQFTYNHTYNINHYYDCIDDDCYIDELNRRYSRKSNPPPKERIIPGKVYYTYDSQRGYVSKYWKDRDPGFFGESTHIAPDGSYDPETTTTYKYDIINTPVLFRMGDFSFAGVVQSWEKDYGSGGQTYRVTIESIDTFLNQCYIIIGEYGGSIFSIDTSNSTYGGPSNYLGDQITYHGKIKQGNIPNVFNVYGFLESLGYGYFGGSNNNDNGLSAVDIIDSLSILTSSISSSSSDPANSLETLNKRAFSPFGRILLKTAQVDKTYQRISPSFGQNSFGIISPTLDTDNIERSHFVLDLSELPRPPKDYRISGPVITITDFIRRITEDTGYDFYYDMIPSSYGGQPYNVIKVRTISRSTQPIPNQIADTIQSLRDNGLEVSAGSIGKEKNDSVPRTLYIGGKQQRLYQAKNYRLAYSQSNYVYNPTTRNFINYTKQGNNFGKTRLPCAFSTRNPTLSSAINGTTLTEIFNNDEKIKNIIDQSQFDTQDTNWLDTGIRSYTSTVDIACGNYGKSNFIKSNTPPTQRYFPIYYDVISPFFGYQMETIAQVDTTDPNNNVYQYVRPVWLDTWTGQLTVICKISELPKTISVALSSLYGSDIFLVTETEIRAAIAGFDSFLVYCAGKLFKPDLFGMLCNAYKNYGIDISGTESEFGNAPIIDTNAAGDEEEPVVAEADDGDTLNFNMDAFINPKFLKDMQLLHNFVNHLGSTYYGKKYLVKIPEINAYRDSQYSDIQLDDSFNNLQVFAGSSKIYFNYEPTNDGAWEEYNNIIDDCILVGSSSWSALTDDNNKIKPILGYNFTDTYDYVRNALYNITDINVNSNDPNFTKLLTVAYNLALMVRDVKINSGNGDDTHFTFPSLDISTLNATDYTVVNIQNTTNDAYGKALPASSAKKLYTTTSLSEKIIFLDPAHFNEARVIVDAPNLNLATTSYSYDTDPNITVIANVAIEDLLIYLKTVPQNLWSPDFIQIMMNYVSPILSTTLLTGAANGNQSSKHMTLSPKAAHPFFAGIPVRSNQYCYGPWTNYPDFDKSTIFPDASSDNVDNAIENLIGGAKIEIKSDFVPWDYGGMSFLDQAVLYEIQANINYQQVLETAQFDMPGLPIFGLGSKFIYQSTNNLGANQISFNNQVFTCTQTTLSYTDNKKQTPAIPDVPTFGFVINPPSSAPTTISRVLPYNIFTLVSANSSEVAPLITNIQLNIGNEIKTTYSFRTYIRKLGFFNKENTDKLKQIALTNNKRNKEIAKINNSIIDNLSKQRQELLNNIGQSPSFSSKDFNSKFFATSPTEVLIGWSRSYIKPPNSAVLKKYQKIIEQMARTDPNSRGYTALQNKLNQITEKYIIPYGSDINDDITTLNKIIENPIKELSNTARKHTSVGMYPAKEVNAELTNKYSQKSAMSLDGIFSPVSFYPTLGNHTFNMAKYDSSYCPYCTGTKIISVKTHDYVNNTDSNVQFFCKYCDPDKSSISYSSSTTKSSSRGEALPPYIITSGTDFNTLLNFNSKLSGSSTSASTPQSSSSAGVNIPINMISLQPIVIPYGDFKNPNIQGTDRCRHSIKVVGRGQIPPQNPLRFNIHKNLHTYLNDQNGTIQTSHEGHNPDYYDLDIVGNKFNRKNNLLNNQRFFGLRGPLMLHGWGYDTEGYPIPNAADEPYYVDSNGRPMRFKLKQKWEQKKYSELSNGDRFTLTENKIDDIYIKSPSLNIRQLTNNQYTFIQPSDNMVVYKYTTENDLSTDPNSPDIYAGTGLGDIISKTQKFQNGKWTPKIKQKEFYLNWAEKPDLWPVGPVDLRWDENRRVWTMNSSNPYKMVYVTLEEDLIRENDFDDTYPARGFLDDLEYSTKPLENGYRRLVYVIDRSGYTAPRGIKLLCRYNSDNGFYEPISKPAIIAVGKILNGTTATIQMNYAQGRRNGEIPTMQVVFDNSQFNFSITAGKNGMFTFLGGKWILTSIQSN
jgi:hypothetical protein